MDSEIVKVENENVGVLMRRSTDVAGVCKEIVLKTAQKIGNRQYVRVEGWQSIAVAYGCVASARDVEVVDGGVRAIGEVRRMSDGAVIATAEGFVGTDEPTWASRPMYARRAMAQTRAVSRACRSAFAFIVTLIDSNLSTTPAEEMDGLTVDSHATPPPAGVEKLRAMATAPAPAASPPKPRPIIQDVPFVGEGGKERPHQAVTFRYGNAKGQTSFEVNDRDLDWYIGGAQKSVDDPAKERFKAANVQELACLQAEARWRAGA